MRETRSGASHRAPPQLASMPMHILLSLLGMALILLIAVLNIGARFVAKFFAPKKV